jgi:hypothetical protein
MLKPEQAQAELAKWRLPEEPNRVAEGVKALPPRLRELAELFYGTAKDEYGRIAGDVEEYWKQQRKATTAIDRMSAGERGQIFSIISPQLAASIERAWQLIKTAPYQIGYYRKAFRAPHSPAAHVVSLQSWAEEMGKLGRGFPPEVLTPAWLAAWIPHVLVSYRSFEREVGTLLAAVISAGGAEADEVFEILRQSLSNQHEIGAPGRHIYTALLLADRPEGWELIEKTLLAAQRQEGLRQAILEAIDFTHPQAFRRMLRLILEHDMTRFSAVTRAVDVWFGQLWAAASGGVIKKILTQVVEYLEDSATRDKALAGKDAEAAFLALWCLATEDAVASVPPAENLLGAKSVELRYVAARHLVNLNLDVAAAAVVQAIDDEDIRVALLGIPTAQYHTESRGRPELKTDDRFERIERLLARLPDKPQKLKPLVWPWTEIEVKKSEVARCLLSTRGERPATRLIPHLRTFDTYARISAAMALAEPTTWDAETRATVLDLAGDAVAGVRDVAFEALLRHQLSPAEIEQLEGYLTRKTGQVRRGALDVLLKQDDASAVASGQRLLASKDASQRLGGLELLRLLTDAKRATAECRRLALEYQAGRKKVSQQEQAQLDEIAQEKVAAATLDDALGLMNPADRTPVVAPRNLGVKFTTTAAAACLKSLDDLVHTHREATIQCKTDSGVEEHLLANISWGFSEPDSKKPRDKQIEKLPLAEVWQEWYAGRGDELKDEDGLELVRAEVLYFMSHGWGCDRWKDWVKQSLDRKTGVELLTGGHGDLELRYATVVLKVLDWLLFLHPVDAREYLLDALESSFAMVRAEDMAQLCDEKAGPTTRGPFGLREDTDWRDVGLHDDWSTALNRHLACVKLELTPEQNVRLWRLMHWRDMPIAGAQRRRVEIELLFDAYSQKAATLADLADHLLGPRAMLDYGQESFNLLSEVTSPSFRKEAAPWLESYPTAAELIDRAVSRILEIELSRGDAPTAATVPAQALRSIIGIETLRRILHALGKAKFEVTSYWRSLGVDRRETLTHLARITHPAEGETAADFARIMQAAVKEGQFPEERILQLTFLAPQWTSFVEHYMGWQQMSEGVYWFLAHMSSVGGLGEAAAVAAGLGGEEQTEDTPASSGDGDVEADGDEAVGPPRRKLSAWERLVLERTPLADSDRQEGAIDVAWFQRTHAQMGDKHWQALAEAARFAANAAQAKRAKRIADVLLNRVKRKVLVDGIKKRQLKEEVRLLGLLPLAKGAKREADLAERCRVLRDYRRYANKLSGLTKPSALRAWEIGMKNLAQTAGFADPLRLEWAIGAEAVKDLAKGPVAVKKDDVTVTLSLDHLARPEVSICKGEKELKSIPAAIKKDKKVAELTGRVAQLKKQAASIRRSLEGAMCRGDTFTGDELRSWCEHALVAPLFARLVIQGEGIAGYPDKGGKALRDFDGKLEPVKAKETLRVAHAFDLFEAGRWQDWQRECFQAERVQPFKQVFRELYVVTKQEKRDGAISHRYDGQQVQPTQAMALFGSRGWNTQDEIIKVFHDADLTAAVSFQSGVTTPLEVEGATFAGVYFRKRGEWKPIPLADVPPRLFSEVMRDLDLVVSVAHAGGVDPEASASTVEMRSGLLRETCSLLQLDNVTLKPSHAVITGELADYSVHLGSGTVHKMPGGSLCIVPVHAQHRGRLFLPFADDDPRTAEVISKVLLLARDVEIQDPTILEQIRR